MASIRISQKKRIYGGTHFAWGAITGTNVVGSGSYQSHSIYSASVDMSGISSINKVYFYNTLFTNALLSGTAHYYLYTSDPTAGGAVSPPTATAISHKTAYLSLNGRRGMETVFDGLNLTGVSMLYVWVTVSYDATSGGFFTDDNNPLVGYASDFAWETSSVTQALTVSPANVAAGGDVTLNVTSGYGYYLTATFRAGSSAGQLLDSYSFTSGTLTILCPASWFDDAGITALSSMTVWVGVTGGIAGGTMTGSFILAASDAMKPAVSGLSVAIVQPSSASDYPNTYISNISKAKVSATVTRPTNAALATNGVVLSFPGGSDVVMTYNSSTGKYEATTAAPITGDTTFTVEAKDVRGLTGRGTIALTGVVDYAEPAVNIVNAYRCDSSGNADDGGPYYRVKATASCNAGIDDNSITGLECSTDGSTWINILNYNGQLTPKQGGTLNEYRTYTLYVRTKDKISGWKMKTATLTGSHRDFVAKRNGNYTNAAVGGTPTARNNNSFELPDDGTYHVGTGAKLSRTKLELPSGGAVEIGGTALVSGHTKAQIVDMIYPVGSIYMSVNRTSPATLFGGTWQRITGRFLLAGTDSSNSGAAQTPGNTGGAATHTLTKAELPDTELGVKFPYNGLEYDAYMYQLTAYTGGGTGIGTFGLNQGNKLHTEALGSGNSFSIMPPFLSVYVWKRTA